MIRKTVHLNRITLDTYGYTFDANIAFCIAFKCVEYRYGLWQTILLFRNYKIYKIKSIKDILICQTEPRVYISLCAVVHMLNVLAAYITNH